MTLGMKNGAIPEIFFFKTPFPEIKTVSFFLKTENWKFPDHAKGDQDGFFMVLRKTEDNPDNKTSSFSFEHEKF
uniref:Uncharacterized protein MANES_08G111800 n=1 Tax=Rhizophora mucronata TaxID=61149 RepID=A0A2P2ILJ5_RHIMU